jgi:hypothetical protein
VSTDVLAGAVGVALLGDAHRLQPTVKAPGALHPREMPEPPAGCEMGGPGCCKACEAPTGFHVWWCAMRGASAREIAALRTTGGGS